MRLSLAIPATALSLLAAFGCSLFFRGTNTVWFAPAIILWLPWAGLMIAAGWREGWRFPRSATAGLIGALWVWLLLAVSWSTAPFVSTLFTIVFSVLPAGLFVLALSPEPLRYARVQGAALLAALGLLALWALVQYFFLYDTYGPRIKHPLLSPNNLAALLNIGLLPAIALFLAAKARWQLALAASAVALFFGGVLVTVSRGGLLAGGGALLFLLAFTALPLTRGRLLRLAGLTAILAATFALIQLYGAEAQGSGPLKSLSGSLGASLIDRQALWESSWRMFVDHFWLGTGFATFSYYYPSYRLPVDISDGYFTHMDPLQFALETGVLTPVLFYVTLIAILLRTLKAVFRSTPGSRERYEIAASFAAMLAVAAHAHIDFHLYMLAITIPLGVALGYWYAATSAVLEDRVLALKPAGRVARMAAALMVLALAFPAQWVARAALATRYTNETDAHLARNDIESARQAVGKARLWAPDSFHNVYYDEARWRILKLTRDRRLSLAEKRTLYEEALANLRAAGARNSALTTLAAVEAQLYALVHGDIIPDGRERAIALMEDVLRRNPLYLDGRLALARLYEEQGELGKALAVLEEGLRWPRVTGQADIDFLVRTARLRLRLGDRAGHDRLINYAGEKARQYGLTRRQ